MATKKPMGLGRGLDELLDDNTPTTREHRGKPLVEPKGEFRKGPTNERVSTLYGNTTKTLYETKPRTKSVKSNFKTK